MFQTWICEFEHILLRAGSAYVTKVDPTCPSCVAHANKLREFFGESLGACAPEVYALEWCSCIHESAFAVESLHTTKRGAVKAMIKMANARWYEERSRHLSSGTYGNGIPLVYQAWQVRRMEVAIDDALPPNDQGNGPRQAQLAEGPR